MGGNKFLIIKVWGGLNLILLILLGTFISCKQPAKYIDESNSKSIKILNENAKLSITIDEIIDSVSYIPLETEKCLLGNIEVVKRDGNRLFIKAGNKLFVFDSDGNFISEISNKGNAPHEYLYIQCFYLDKKNKHVCIISHPDKKLLRYSYDGDFIYSINNLPEDISIMSSAICLTHDGLVVYNALSTEINMRVAEYTLYSNNSNSFDIKPLIKGVDCKSNEVYYPFIYKPMTLYNNELFMVSALSNAVYKFDKNIAFEAFRIDIPNLNPPTDLMKENEKKDFFSLKKIIEEKGYGLGITGISTIESCLILFLNNSNTLITDCNEGILIDSKIYDRNTNVYLSHLFTDGISEDYLGVYDASYLLSVQKYILQNDNTRLKEILKTIKEEDNPIVFQYHFKNDLFSLLKSLVEKKSL